MADSEIAAMVDEGWLARVKAGGDEHPLIKAFTIAHEGSSDIKLDGILTPLHWVKDAIGWINNKIQLYTPAFNRHGAGGDNSHDGRVPIGEIVGSKLVEEGDRTATIAAMYIYPRYRNLKLDVASIEADITYARDGNTVWPTGINKITGIALDDSDHSRPGFSDATLIGSIAAFAEGGTVTIQDIKSAIDSQGIKPGDLFNQEVLTASDAVRTYIAQEKKDTREHARRVTEERDDALKKVDSMKVEHSQEVLVLKTENMSSKTSTIFGGIADERKLDAGERHYVDLQLKRFQSKSTEPDKFKADLNTFVDEALVDLGALKPTLGIKSDSGSGEGAGSGDGSGDGSGAASNLPPDNFEDDHVPGSEDGMMDSDVNSLIPGGKADLEYNKQT